MEKLTYVTPAVQFLGSFEDITKGTSTGEHLDEAIPVGFPVTDIPGFVDNHVS